jgi:hypothetical protein
MDKNTKLKAVIDYVKEHDLDKKKRDNTTAWMRFYLFAYMKAEFKGMSHHNIGAIMNKHHSSVIHGIKCHNEWILNDIAYKMTIHETAIQFPIDGQIITSVNMTPVTAEFTPDEFKKLKMYRISNDLKSNADAIKSLVQSIDIKVN